MTGKAQVAGVGADLVSRATIEATIIRADGTIEELGVISDSGLLRPPPCRGFLQRMKDRIWPRH